MLTYFEIETVQRSRLGEVETVGKSGFIKVETTSGRVFMEEYQRVLSSGICKHKWSTGGLDQLSYA